MVHKYELNGYKIVLDVCSGALYSVDSVTYDIFDCLNDSIDENIDESIINSLKEKYSVDEIEEAYSQIYKAFKKGMIFSEDKHKKISETVDLDSPIKAMCINIAHDCNMICEYCFAAKGDFGCGRELMTFETAKKAIDFLVENSKNRRNLEVEFFGGEPLMAFDIIKQTVKYARNLEEEYNKNFRFTLTTNGILLNDEKIDFINKEIYTVVLSLDGRKDINDKMRRTRSGEGTYDIIIPKFRKLIDQRGRKNYHIRGTFTKNNLKFSEDVLHIYNLGFSKISIEPVIGDEKKEYNISESDLKIVLNEYENLAKKIYHMRKNGSDIDFYRFNIDLEKSPCSVKRLKGCSCGNEFIAVTPNGDIFPCHQFVGNKQFLMGNLNKKLFNTNMKKSFSEINMYKKENCGSCWARFFCGGGCNANNFNFMGRIKTPHAISCQIEKKRIECALMLNVALKSIKLK